ncbi:hypothetical protein SAMN05660880_01102 [Luteibacter sp. 22Crub2.1]|nr:hypothetical protein SAMN05660880_01102 [Luteibacter sp. 22Crub2.1]
MPEPRRRQARVRWLGIATCCLAGMAQARVQPPKEAPQTDETTLRCKDAGKVVNDYYGFTALFPGSLHAYPDSPIDMTDHGCVVSLDDTAGSDRSIDLFAAYNAALDDTVRQATDERIDGMTHDETIDHVILVSRRAMSLGGLKAERSVIRYRDKSTGRPHVSDVVIALRHIVKPSDGFSHTYTVSLTTTEEAYEGDRVTFEAILASWRTIRAEDSP